ncbi:MAG TPA: chromate efflux transporter [Casimicrobiaceae bacterium]|jgi:chromate transporter|nr:chromate efflux transporter [Casimicrobiaceae bacterium]
MMPGNADPFARRWKEIAWSFFRLGVMSYGGPAIMGVMQTELQEKRKWVTKDRFVEGLSLVNMLPGAGATQLAIFLGYARSGWWGGLVAGLCFVLPAFFIMLALTIGYSALGATPLVRGALYGLGPVVLAIFLVAVYRLGKSAIATVAQALIAVGAAAAAVFTSIGVAESLLLAGAVGLLLFHSRKIGITALITVAVLLGGLHVALWPPLAPEALDAAPVSSGLQEVAIFFFKVGALTFGGGLSMIAFIQDQVVNQFHWLNPHEFIDGLALGQLTPGPILMLAAYVGFKVAGLAGAAVGAAAIFLPSFILMLSILPVFDRVRKLVWTKAAMKGIGPAVIGALSVSLFQLAPHALPDGFAIIISVASVAALFVWRISAVKLMLAGSILGVLRSRLLRLLSSPGASVF